MPLVAHSQLPSFSRLRESGLEVLDADRAAQQDVRELHIGLLNMMPDAALEATERQFMRLLGSSNRIAQFYVHPFTIEGVDREGEAGEHVANGVSNPKAHLRKAVTEDQIMAAPIIAHPLGLFDCCGVSDGAACAIVATPEMAKQLGKKDFITVKSLQLALSSGEELGYNDWDGDHFVTTSKCSTKAYQEAGITNPKKEISMMEVHDCFSITELVTMEDLHISERGQAYQDVMDGMFDRDGETPCQVDGGLKCFGHPIGASGLRMLYEMYLQFYGQAGERQIEDPRFGLTHNLGGFPAMNVCSISIVGKYDQK